MDTVWSGLKTVCPILELVEAAFTGTLTFISDLWNGMSLYDAGAKLIDTLVEGVKAMAMKPVETVKGIYKDIKGAFGFGDDEEPQPAKAAVEGAKAAYPGKDTASKQENGFWESVGDFFTFGSNPEQAALQPAAAGTPFIGPTKPALSEATTKPAQAKLPGQARTAPASSRVPEYAASGETRRTAPDPPGNQSICIFPCPSPSTASLLRTWATRCCAASTAALPPLRNGLPACSATSSEIRGDSPMATEYITQQGDCWDAIALRLWGDEHLMDRLIAANIEHMDMLEFPAGVRLNVPGGIKKPEINMELPPWM